MRFRAVLAVLGFGSAVALAQANNRGSNAPAPQDFSPRPDSSSLLSSLSAGYLNILVLLPPPPPRPLATQYNTQREVTLAELGQTSQDPNPKAAEASIDPIWETLREQLKNSFPNLRVSMQFVTADVFDAGKSSPATPKSYNAVMANPFPPIAVQPRGYKAARADRTFGTTQLGIWDAPAQVEAPEEPAVACPEVAPIQARGPSAALALWLADDRHVVKETTVYGTDMAPVDAAVNALRTALNGADLSSEADPQFARFDAPGTRLEVLNPAPLVALNKLEVHIGLEAMQENGKLAVVRLHGWVAQGDVFDFTQFGGIHAVVTLRMQPTGEWRVLQILPNLSYTQQDRAWKMLSSYASKISPEKIEHPLGISQASPVDHDGRAPAPDFWWDNRGGASLQVLEWQRRQRDEWLGSNLFFVPDTDPRLKTQVRGTFANLPGEYRWRIWSLGKGGDLNLSDWRALTIFPN